MHPSDERLAAFADAQAGADEGTAEHVRACAVCRARIDDLARLRALLADAGRYERRSPRNVIPGALKRLRLRRHTIVNANELLDGFVAFVRGFATLFAVDDHADTPGRTAPRRKPHD